MEPSHSLGRWFFSFPFSNRSVFRDRHEFLGFVPASRRQLFEKLRPLVIPQCPFVNLPETHRSRWGEGLTAEDMKECAWTRPELVAQIEFLEWTESDHLRLAKFAGLREDKDPRSVVKEQATREFPSGTGDFG